jgi:hypothetical protein
MWKQVELSNEELLNNVRVAENKLADTLADLVLNYKGVNTYQLASNEDFKRTVYNLIDALQEFQQS